jgi:N-methylhydantoinase B
MGRENLEAGDVNISTVPIIIGSHSADILLFIPIFYNGKLFGFAATKSHLNDIGAKAVFPTDSRSTYEEGLHLPPLKLYRAGKLQPEIWEIIKWNTRTPDLVWGDIKAMISGCHFAEKRLAELLGKYGMQTVTECIEEIYNYSERIVRQAIQKMPQGTWSAEDYLDSNGIDLEKPVLTRVTITVQGSDITVDFTGSAPQQNGPVNGLFIGTLSSTRGAIKALTAPESPANEGSFRPVKVVIPENSVYAAGAMAPSFMYFQINIQIVELLNKALNKVLPDKIPACSGGDACGAGYYGINPTTGKYWMTLTPCAVGQGASRYSDGDAYVHPLDTSCAKNAPVEVLESSYPIIVDKVELVRDSGGAGKHRGGPGAALYIQLPVSATFFCFIEKSKTPHWGIDGGKDGLRNYALVHSEEKGEFEVLKSTGISLNAGDSVTVVAGGGGGYGDPLERDVGAIREDVINGYVSVGRARQDYGVVIDPRTLDIDVAATQELRRELRTN